MYIRASGTIENAVKSGVKILRKKELKYYHIKYGCIHGGKKFKKRSAGNKTQGKYPVMVQHVLDSSVRDRLQIVSNFNTSKTKWVCRRIKETH